MRLKGILAAVLIAVSLAGCASTATLMNNFSAQEAAFINTQGKATVTGQAFLRRNDGMVVYGAGSQVILIPKTTYSSERMAAIYKGAHISYFPLTFKNDDPNYQNYARKTVANGEGRFKFENVAPGSYYVVTNVTWMVEYVQGGSLMAEVTVVGDQSPPELIMNGQ